MRITFADREIGDGAPTFVIAEIGSNHDGELDRALALIDAAAAAGADAVKFQSFRAAGLLARRWPDGGGWKAAEAYPVLERLEVPAEWHAPLKERARERDVVFLSTPFDESRAALLAALGVPGFKVASGDLTHHPLLRALATYGRPILLSTGLAEPDEIAAALDAIEEGAGAPERVPPVVLLHCVSLYPLRPGDANLRALEPLRARFGCLVGWSDHSPGHTLALGAVALGACVVEKHITDDRGRRGPDHPYAMEPREFGAMVAAIRELETGLGDGAKRPRPDEQPERRWARRSVYAARSLPAGSRLEATDLKIVRPALGLEPDAILRLVGRRLRRPLAVDEPIRDEDAPS